MEIFVGLIWVSLKRMGHIGGKSSMWNLITFKEREKLAAAWQIQQLVR